MEAPTELVPSTESEESLSSEESKGSHPETSPPTGMTEAAQVTPPPAGSKPRSRVQDIIMKIEQGQIKGQSPENTSEYASLKSRSRVASVDTQNSFRRSPTEKEDHGGEHDVKTTNSFGPTTPSPVRKFTPTTTPPTPSASPISPYVDQDDLGLLEQKLFFAAESPLSKYLDKANTTEPSATTVKNVTVTRESFPMHGSAGSETRMGVSNSWSSIFKALPLSPVDKPLPSLPREHDIFEDSPTKGPSTTVALTLLYLSQKAVEFPDPAAQADELAHAAAEQRTDPTAAAAEWRDIRSYLWADMDADDDNPHCPQPATPELREKIEGGERQSPDDDPDATDTDPGTMEGPDASPAPAPTLRAGHDHEDHSDMTDEDLAACMALLQMKRGGDEEAQAAWTTVRPRRPTLSRERMAEIDAYVEASPSQR